MARGLSKIASGKRSYFIDKNTKAQRRYIKRLYDFLSS
jgi:hypothetical protein